MHEATVKPRNVQPATEGGNYLLTAAARYVIGACWFVIRGRRETRIAVVNRH